MVVFGPVCLVPSKAVWWAAGAYTRGGFDLFVVIFMMFPRPPFVCQLLSSNCSLERLHMTPPPPPPTHCVTNH